MFLRMGFASVVGALLASGVSAQTSQDLARRVRDAITVGELQQHARVITNFQRPSGSAGEFAAIEYIVRTLREAGVPVTVHEFSAYVSNPVAASLSVVGVPFSPEAITVAFSAEVRELTARLVDVGPLSDLPELEVGTGERLVLPNGGAGRMPDLTGSVALVDGLPRNVPVTVLTELGALGAIFINPEERLNDLIVTSTWGSPSLRNAHRIPTIPVLEVKRSAGEQLRTMLRRRDISVTITTEVDQGWRTLRLPVARIHPGDPEAPYTLIGGHIDGWYFGGTDEGASNAAMLSMAVVFHRQRSEMRRGLVVAWWPGHSNARYGGSTWFADQYFEEMRDRAVAYLNIDGVGQRGARQFSATATASLRPLAISVLEQRTGLDGFPVTRPGRNSDQSFNGIGLPLLQFNHTRLAEDGGYWWWHTPDDTFDKIDFDVLAQDTHLYVDAISQLSARESLPLDLVGQLQALVDALQRRAVEAEGLFDLSDIVSQAERLVRIAQTLEDDRATWEGALDLHILRILRPIHRILFSPFGPYHPDPGRELGPVPGLAPIAILAATAPADHRHQLALVSLVRERNRIADALEHARRLLVERPSAR